MSAAFHRDLRPLQRLEGRASDVPLPVLLHALYSARRTCGIELRRLEQQKTLFLEEGALVACVSNLPTESFGSYLVEKGALTGAQQLQTQEEAHRSKLPWEQLLVHQGLLDEVTLTRHKQMHLARKILECFRWADAQYRVVPYGGRPEAPKISPVALLFTAATTFQPIQQVTSALQFPPEQRLARVRNPAHAQGELRLNPKDARLLELLDLHPTLPQLIESSGMEPEAVMRRVYAFGLLGFVECIGVELPSNVPGNGAAALSLMPAEPRTIQAPREATALFGADEPKQRVAPPARSRRGKWLTVLLLALVAGGGVLAYRAQELGLAELSFLKRGAPEPRRVVTLARPAARPVPEPEPRRIIPAPEGAQSRPDLPRDLFLSVSQVPFALPSAPAGSPEAAAVSRASRTLRSGQWARAEQAFRDLTERSPESPGAWYGLALSHYVRGADTQAREAVSQALALDPVHAPSLLLRGYLEQLAGHGSAARRDYAAYLEAESVSDYADDIRSIAAQLPEDEGL